MAEEFTGFANAPVDKKGKSLDFRDVDGFVDESDEGKAVESSRRTPSSIVTSKTNDAATDGAPAAEVPDAVGEDKTGGTPDADKSTSKASNPTTAKAAGGKEASGS